jgi:hypothetical protein
MQRSELQQHLQMLQGKRLIFEKRIQDLQQKIVAKQQELAIQTQDVHAEREAALKAGREALEVLYHTLPARNGQEDRHRHAMALVRPLTRTELAIDSLKRSWLNWIFAVLSPQVARMQSVNLRQLRQQVWREWQYEVHTLQRDIERMSREALEDWETNAQRILRNEIEQLQRELPRLEQQHQLMLIEIDGLQKRIALEAAHEQTRLQIEQDRVAEALARRKAAELQQAEEQERLNAGRAARAAAATKRAAEEHARQVILAAQVQEALDRKQAAKLFKEAAQAQMAKTQAVSTPSPDGSSDNPVITAEVVLLEDASQA